MEEVRIADELFAELVVEMAELGDEDPIESLARMGIYPRGDSQ